MVPFIRARYYTPVTGTRKVGLIVIHTMENDEKPTGAEDVARWFSGPTSSRASAHYCVDTNSVVQCVRDNDVAWAAPGANHNGIHVELAGRAAQKARDWQDAYSQAELLVAAKLVARLCRKYRIPVRVVRPNALKLGRRGITGHVDVSEAFGLSDHWDPGPHFPWAQFLLLVKEADRPPVVRRDPEPKPQPKLRPLPGPAKKPKWFWPALAEFLRRRKK